MKITSSINSRTFGNYSIVEYVINNLPNGMGNTIGNVIRRTIVGSTEGTAIIAYKLLPCFKHEFDHSSHLVEDASMLMLRLKDVIISDNADIKEIKCVYYKFTGPGQFTAKDLEQDGITVINKDVVLFNVSSDIEIDFVVYYNRGHGFVLHKDNRALLQDGQNLICVTSIYSRFSRVNFAAAKDESTAEGLETVTITAEYPNCYRKDDVIINAITKNIVMLQDVLLSFISEREAVTSNKFKDMVINMMIIMEMSKIVVNYFKNCDFCDINQFNEIINNAVDMRRIGFKKKAIRDLEARISETINNQNQTSDDEA